MLHQGFSTCEPECPQISVNPKIRHLCGEHLSMIFPQTGFSGIRNKLQTDYNKAQTYWFKLKKNYQSTILSINKHLHMGLWPQGWETDSLDREHVVLSTSIGVIKDNTHFCYSTLEELHFLHVCFTLTMRILLDREPAVLQWEHSITPVPGLDGKTLLMNSNIITGHSF